MSSLPMLLTASSTVVLDGAMGTMVQAAGLDAGGAAELWNVDRPHDVAAIHTGYLEAGSRVVTTNTFGGTRPRLDMYGLGDRVVELNRAGAALARQAAIPFGALVAGDVGPTGELLEPLGTLSRAAAQELFAEQLRGLLLGGIDLVLIETMSDLAEAEAAVLAARSVAAEIPVLVTFSFDTNLRTMMGVTPAAAVAAMAALGVTAVGANCGRGPEEMEAVMAQMAEAAVPTSCWWHSPTPDCRSSSATTSSTTRPQRRWRHTPAGFRRSVSTSSVPAAGRPLTICGP